ncbi:hypothetical protein C0J52_27673, partial [Blattella germanica]
DLATENILNNSSYLPEKLLIFWKAEPIECLRILARYSEIPTAAKAAHFAAYNAAASAAAGAPAHHGAPAYNPAPAYNGAPAYPGAYAGAPAYPGAPGYPAAAPAYGGHYGGAPAVPADTPEVAAAKAAHFAAHAQASGQHYVSRPMFLCEGVSLIQRSPTTEKVIVQVHAGRNMIRVKRNRERKGEQKDNESRTKVRYGEGIYTFDGLHTSQHFPITLGRHKNFQKFTTTAKMCQILRVSSQKYVLFNHTSIYLFSKLRAYNTDPIRHSVNMCLHYRPGVAKLFDNPSHFFKI